MEVGGFGSDVAALDGKAVRSVVEAAVVQTLVAAHRSLLYLLMATGSLLKDIDMLPKFTGIDERFPLDELHRIKKPDMENKDASDGEDDEEEDNDEEDPEDHDDDDDEDFSGDEGGEDDDDEADPEENPAANGNEGSDDEDDDEDGDEDDDEDDEEEEEGEEDEEEDQPPAKKRK